MPATTTPFIAALPKTELHLHLVGSASPNTVLELARRHPDAGVPTEPGELAKFYEFRDFPHFLDVYIKVDEMVRTAADVLTLLDGLASDAAASNVRYAEVTVTASMQLAKGISPETLVEALATAREDAMRRHGVAFNWIFDIPAGLGPDHAKTTVDFAIKHRPPGTVALGLAGFEEGYPRAGYRDEFALAADAGLHRVVHAGETTGPDEVWSALRDLGAERIGHGVGAARDPELMDYLAENGITLELCPTSNICTRAVPALPEHPLPSLLSRGIPISLSTDDPGMFATNLNREYTIVAEQFDLCNAQLAEIARNGFRAGFCDDKLREAALAEIDEVLATE